MIVIIFSDLFKAREPSIELDYVYFLLDLQVLSVLSFEYIVIGFLPEHDMLHIVFLPS